MSGSKKVVRAKVVGRNGAVVSSCVIAARSDARRIIEQAGAQAEQILAQAHVDADTIREQARRQGRQEGLAEVTGLLAKARKDGEALRHQAVSSLVTLAVRVAEKVLGAEIQTRPEVVLTRVLDALEQVAWCRRIVIRVHPEDLEILRERKEDLLARLPEASVDLVPDREITRGGCRIDSEAGEIDATLETQLAALERSLAESMDE